MFTHAARRFSRRSVARSCASWFSPTVVRTMTGVIGEDRRRCARTPAARRSTRRNRRGPSPRRSARVRSVSSVSSEPQPMKKILLLLAVAAFAVIGYEYVTFPNVGALEKETPKTTAFMDLRREQLRGEGKDDTLQFHPVSYGKISPYLRRAVLVA